ncbi:MAG: AraC family transcriptional regulator [Actinomycetota bacterium]
MTELLGPVPFDYRVRVPEGPLRRLVESIWYARGTVPYTREKIAPTGSTVAVFVLGDPIKQTADNGEAPPVVSERGFLIGPHDRPTVNEPLGETFAVGIVCTPVGCRPVFGVDPADIAGRVAPIESVWPTARVIGRALRNGSAGGTPPGPDEMLDVVEAAVVDGLDDGVAGIDRCTRAVRLLEEDPTRSIGDLAAELAVSHGHLDREFTRVVGLSPRVLGRLLRMRSLLSRIDVRGEVGWSDRAAELGWYDQAHLIRDFKRHTGVTPTRYLEAQRASYTTVEAGDAAGFVPEP